MQLLVLAQHGRQLFHFLGRLSNRLPFFDVATTEVGLDSRVALRCRVARRKGFLIQGLIDEASHSRVPYQAFVLLL